MFIFTQEDAKSIAGLIDDSALEHLGTELLKKHATSIDKSLMFHERGQQRKLLEMIQQTNRHTKTCNLRLVAGIGTPIAFEVVRRHTEQSCHQPPRATTWKSPEKAISERQFPIVK